MNRTDLFLPIEYVVTHSTEVKIDEAAIDRLAANFSLPKLPHWSLTCPFAYKNLPRLEDEIDFRFLADAMAFCFWGYPKKWTITYLGHRLDGWWALIAAFKAAISSGKPILDGDYLAKLTIEEARQIFIGVPEIPLFRERFAILRGIGQVLAEKYHGRFHGYLQKAPTKALDLLAEVVEEFPGFDDRAKYRGKQVYFYKKAQLLVDDLVQIKGVEKVITLTGLDELTGKADYKVPALLRNQGVLVYSDKLAGLIDKRLELPEGSLMEVEIRANMLYALSLLTQKLKDDFPTITPARLDGILWNMTQKKSQDSKPYHLTKTVNY